jgi:outer membrane murein-binding lipoprotein Lpp
VSFTGEASMLSHRYVSVLVFASLPLPFTAGCNSKGSDEVAKARSELEAARSELSAARSELEAARSGLSAARSEIQQTKAELKRIDKEFSGLKKREQPQVPVCQHKSK